MRRVFISVCMFVRFPLFAQMISAIVSISCPHPMRENTGFMMLSISDVPRMTIIENPSTFQKIIHTFPLTSFVDVKKVLRAPDSSESI